MGTSKAYSVTHLFDEMGTLYPHVHCDIYKSPFASSQYLSPTSFQYYLSALWCILLRISSQIFVWVPVSLAFCMCFLVAITMHLSISQYNRASWCSINPKTHIWYVPETILNLSWGIGYPDWGFRWFYLVSAGVMVDSDQDLLQISVYSLFVAISWNSVLNKLSNQRVSITSEVNGAGVLLPSEFFE